MSKDFPQPIRLRGRLFWRRSQLEAYKQKLISGNVVETAQTVAAEEFVPAKTVAREFGVCRRTLGRFIESDNSSAA